MSVTRPFDIKEFSNGIISRKMVEMRPQSTCTGDNFKGTINFNFTYSGIDEAIYHKSYFYLKYNIADKAGTKLGATFFPSMLTMPCLFSSIKHTINNTVIDNIQDPPQIEAYLKRTSTDKAYRDTVGIAENFTTAGTDVTSYLNNDLCWIPACLAMFNQPQPVPPTANHQISLTVAQNWDKRMIQTSAAADYCDGATVHGYDVEITDFVFYLCLEEKDQTPSGEIAYDCSGCDCYISAASQNYHQNYTVRPSTYKAGFAIQSNLVNDRSGNGQLVAPTIFRSYANNWHKRLIQLKIKYGSKVLPEGDYINSFTADTTNYFRRNYMDLILQNDLYVKGFESLTENLDTFGTIWSFDFLKPSNDRSTSMDVTATFDNAVANCNTLLFTEYKKVIILKYNDNREITEVFLSEN